MMGGSILNIRKIRKATITCLLMVVFSLVGVNSAFAWQEMHSEGSGTITLAGDQVIADDLLIAGQDAVIDGTVNGDLLCFGRNITINGTVNGDVIGFCYDLTINGKVNDDVRVAAQNISLQGQVASNFSAAANHLYLGESARIGGNVTLAGETAAISTPIQGNIHSYTRSLAIASTVGRNVTAFTEQLTISSGAAIGGKLIYTSNEPASIAQDVKIAGGITHKLPPQPKKQEKPAPFGGVIWFLVGLASTCLVWYIWRLIGPESFDRMEQRMSTAPWPAVGWGMLLFFIVPIAAILLLCTVIGIPISILGIIAYGVSLYIGKIIVGSWLGHLAADKSGKPELLSHPNLMAIAGILVVMLLGSVPFLGFWVKWLIGAAGLGCVFLVIRDMIAARNAAV
jgi:cytoskeletal protein CcmA (bactofilin family)